MSRQLASIRPGRFLGLIALATALGGCDQLDGLVGGADAGAPAASAVEAGGGPAPVMKVEERDVERPDVFELEAKGLWDGRFSFGDKWVAVAANIRAERVRIINEANGREIEGALFQKEDDLPGPPIMVSQNAAEALDMLPGTPVDMRVVVIRREVVQVPGAEEAAPVPIAEAGQVFQIDGVSTTAIPGSVAPAPVAAAPMAPGAGANAAAAEVPAVEAISTEALETTTLGTTALDANEADDASTGSRAATEGRWIQVVNGGNKDGAELTLKRLKDNGLNGTVRENGRESARLYRVVAGPYGTDAAFTAALAKIRDLGYRDAFAAQ